MTDTYIAILEYARDNPGFEIEELENIFPNDFEWIKREYLHGHLFQTDTAEQNKKYYLSFEDRSKLLEYEELHDARKSSKQAMWVATISILLTLTGLIYQIFFSK